ncbi:hypothetical protein CONLIGDRAFT_686822 [Coniochaeta ligniaria NRRL 30616]|uniref:Uncharacterized protein n=1 Tax=Coniochaeta ligniaria NRRL 30616 TaxID=1408157 RepID=A0A1J7IQK3_9PEZI|nr:hypothetical protein CONLIGDRAFT_686822 [Coniochaeta ligniaria NRRL 30616]
MSHMATCSWLHRKHTSLSTPTLRSTTYAIPYATAQWQREEVPTHPAESPRGRDFLRTALNPQTPQPSTYPHYPHPPNYRDHVHHNNRSGTCSQREDCNVPYTPPDTEMTVPETLLRCSG